MMRSLLVVVVIAALFASRPAVADDEPGALYSCHAATGKISASFKPETSIKDLATWLIGFTCKNVVLGAGVLKADAAVTIIAPDKMTPKQAVQLWIDAVEAAGFVVVQKPDTFVVKLGPNMPHGCVAVANDAALPPGSIQPTPPPPSAPPAVADFDFDTNLRHVDDTHVKVTQAFVDHVFDNPMALAKFARIVPATKDGKPDGFKLYGIRPGSPVAQLNFANGDTFVAINGFALTSADTALEAYMKIKDAKQFAIDVIRRGKPMQLLVTVVGKLPF